MGEGRRGLVDGDTGHGGREESRKSGAGRGREVFPCPSVVPLGATGIYWPVLVLFLSSHFDGSDDEGHLFQ